MFCTECGTKLVDGAKYCYNCGAAVQAERTVPQEPAKPQEQPVSEAQSAPEENIMTGTAAISISKRISDQAESLAAKYEEPEAQPQTQAVQPKTEYAQPEPKVSEQPEPIAPAYKAAPALPDAPASPKTAPLSGENAPVDKSIDGDLLGMLTMILAGASFLFITVSLTGANWVFRTLVLIACACLTFFTARKHELPRQGLALPPAVFLVASIGGRLADIISRLMHHQSAGLSLEGIIYRTALLIALVMMVFIVFKESGRKKPLTAAFMVLSGLFACYHLIVFVTSFKLGRGVVMYNLGMFAFFAAYVLISWRYISKHKTEDEAENTVQYSQVHVEERTEAPQPQPETGFAIPDPKPGAGMVWCGRCGEKIPADSEFCPKCGYPVR